MAKLTKKELEVCKFLKTEIMKTFEPLPISLKEYADLVGFDKETEPKTLQEIQDYVEENHDVCLWDYPLGERIYCQEEDKKVVLVKTDFGLRYCEIS